MSDREAFVSAQMCRDSLYFFTRWMFRHRRGYRWIQGRHHLAIAAALERVVRGECRRLIINIPPRAGKTEMAVINFIAWSLGLFPDSEFIYTSYSARLASNFSWQTRELVVSNEYGRIFPGCKVREDSRAKDEWRTTAGGIVYSVGAGGTITGYGAGKHRDGFSGALIIDDPHKADEASSDVIRAGVIDWFQNTLESRRNNPNTPIILIMQRLHQSDLAGWLLGDRGHDMTGPPVPGGNGEVWEHVCLPALQADGTSLWPEKWSVSELHRMQTAAPYIFSGQYQQRPSPAEGGVIKPGRMGFVDAAPPDCEWVRGWDLAATDGDGDWTAGVRLGRTPDGRFFIGHVTRAQFGVDDRDELLCKTTEMDGVSTTVSIPQDPGQAGKTQALYLVRKLAGFVVKSSPESGDKVVRAGPVASQINIGNVWMVRGEWNTALVDELRMFPNGTHDDQVDALARAFAEFVARYPSEIFFPDRDVAFNERQRAVNAAMPGLPPGVLDAMRSLPEGQVCGRCSAFEDGRCTERNFTVLPADPGCGMWMPIVGPS